MTKIMLQRRGVKFLTCDYQNIVANPKWIHSKGGNITVLL